MITAVYYKSGNDKSDNNKDKVYLLLGRWVLVSHVLDHMLDHMFNYMIDAIIINLVTTVVQFPFFLVWAPTNK